MVLLRGSDAAEAQGQTLVANLILRRNLDEILASQRKMIINRGEDPDQMDDAQVAAMFDQAAKEGVCNSWKQTTSASIRARMTWTALYSSLPTAPTPFSML